LLYVLPFPYLPTYSSSQYVEKNKNCYAGIYSLYSHIMFCVSNILKRKDTGTIHYCFKKIATKVKGIHFKNSTQQTVPAKNSMC
jgi:hypothetical protein